MNQQSISGTNQFHFVPISRSVSNMGSSVSYSLRGNTDVSAFNTNTLNNMSGNSSNMLGTGQYMSFQQPNWNTLGYTNTNTMVSANQFNQSPSGTYFAPTGYNFRSMLVQPGIDISETSSDVVVTAHVSNLGINNLHLDVTDNSVTISGTAWTGNQNIVLNRTVALPTSVRAESVEAHYQNGSGIVEIRCPKTEKHTRQRMTISTDSGQQA